VSATMADFSFAEMLDANERETGKWQSWFERQPAELFDLPLNIALAKNVREFLLHIFAVELRYAERLGGLPITKYESLPTGSVAELFGIGEKARTLFRDYLAGATNEDLAVVLEFPTRISGITERQQTQDVRPCHAARRSPLGATSNCVARGRSRHRLGT